MLIKWVIKGDGEMYSKDTIVQILRKKAEEYKVLSEVYTQAAYTISTGGTQQQNQNQKPPMKRELPSVAYKIGY